MENKRLIDANKCPCNTCRTQYCGDPRQCTNFMMWLRFQKMGAVDDVEVTRCMDCKYRYFNSGHETYYCKNASGLAETVEPDDFCSYGERK